MENWKNKYVGDEIRHLQRGCKANYDVSRRQSLPYNTTFKNMHKWYIF